MTGYEQIAVLSDPDGVSARITRRAGRDGQVQYSYQFFRTYHKDGEPHETVWFSRRHLAAIGRLAPQVDERLAREHEGTP